MSKAWPAAQKFPRPSLGDGVTTARFDPHTFLLWHRKGALTPRQLHGIKVYPSLNHRKPGLAIDLDASDAPVDLIAAFHEQTHWIQLNATSIGALLTTLKLYQHVWVRTELEEISAAERAALFERRRAGQPIFAVAADYGPVLEHLGPVMRDFAGIWWEYVVAVSFLSGTLGTPELGTHDIANVMGNVLGEIAHSAIGGTHADRDLYLALAQAFATPEWNQLRTEKCGLTTNDLFEAGASVHELAILTAAQEHGIEDAALTARLQERYQQIEKHPYFAAVRIFCNYLGVDPRVIAVRDDVQRAFLAVLDLALNPPVPPFVSREVAERIASGPPGGAFSVKQLYPPLRFLSLCLGMKALESHVELPRDDADTVDLEEKLCYVTQLIATRDLPPPWPAHAPLDFTLLEDDEASLQQLRLLDYFRTVQSQLWQLRAEQAGFSTAYVAAIELADDVETNERLLLEQYGGIVQPLIQLGRFGKSSYTLLPAPGLDRLQQHLTVKSAYEFLLSDVFGNVGPLSLQGYPAVLADNPAVRDNLLNEYAFRFGDGAGLELHAGR